MDTEDLGRSPILNWILKPAGLLMGSRVRGLFFNPVKTLEGAGIKPGQTILEVGCGTGFFTVPAGRMLGGNGSLIAMDAVAGFVDVVQKKVDADGLDNVHVERRDVLKTGLENSSIDVALLFGVLPWPALPLRKLLPEMYRVLKTDGRIAVWMFPVAGWVPGAIARSEWFVDAGKRYGVYNYRKRLAGKHSH